MESTDQKVSRLDEALGRLKALVLRHADRHGGGGSDPTKITTSAHPRLHALTDALDHSGSISSTQHGSIATSDLHPEYQKESLLTTLGDMIYATAASVWARLAGNTATTKKFLTQTGDSAASAAPVWGTILNADIPNPLDNSIDATFGTEADIVVGAKVTGDADRRYQLLSDGQVTWGDGSVAGDVTLGRLSANKLGLAPGDTWQSDTAEHDHIEEKTADHGVVIDSVPLKDGLVDGRDVSADGATLDDHNARHEPGGDDPMAVDAAAATGSLRTIGTGATTACAGNDARLSDARTPAAHGPSKHTEGTAWRLIYLNADGDETEIVLGANGTFLESNGAAAAPAFRAVVHGDVGTTSMKQAFLLTAGAGRATTTAGCSAPTLIEAGTNDVDYVVLDFDKDTDEYAFWGPVVTPYNWDGSTVTATLYWTAAAGSAGQTVVWSIQMASRANDEAIDAAWGTAVAVSDALIATGDVHRTPASGAITPAGTPAGGELLFVRVMRDVSEDTLAGDARLIGVWIEYGVSTLST